MSHLGECIKRLRRTHHLTQQQLADRLDMDQGAVSRWERGHILPSARYRKALEELFGTSLLELDAPLLESVNRDLHSTLLLDCQLQVLAASETALAINGCRSREELVGTSYKPLLNETAMNLYQWMQDAGAFDDGVNWAHFILPTPTLHSGYRWMESLWIPFRLADDQLVYRITGRLLETLPEGRLGRALLDVQGRQLELLLPVSPSSYTSFEESQGEDPGWDEVV